MITGHGGNVQALAERNYCSIDEIIDMSSNINPLGPPEGVEAFIADNIAKIRSLPQPDARDMVEAFSRFYHVPSNRVIGGNGTTWFIYTLPWALKSKKVLIVGPTYADYRDGCIMHQVPFEFCMAEEENDFQPDLDAVSQALSRQPDMDTVIICNPNNPTGTLIPVDDLKVLLKKHADTYFVIDESYLPFVPDAESLSLVAETSFPNLIVLSSMSKIFRIPGLRTGYLCADPSVIDRLMLFYQPWSVNALSQAAIVHILNNPGNISPFLEMSREFARREKKVFLDSFEGCPGLQLQFYPGETYFVLAKLTGDLKSHEVCHGVGNHRILIRDCANFHGLSDRFVRFSLRDRKSNIQLSEILKNLTLPSSNEKKI